MMKRAGVQTSAQAKCHNDEKKVLAPELRLDQWADLHWLSNWFWVTETWGCIGMEEVSSVLYPADNRENVDKNV